jgi:hypothetical protein
VLEDPLPTVDLGVLDAMRRQATATLDRLRERLLAD